MKNKLRISTAIVSAIAMFTPIVANATMIGGDAASYQGVIDMDAYSKSGATFLIEKATEGSGYVNKYADVNIQNAVNRGMRVGTYHFARPEKSSSASEAEWFISQTRGYIEQHVLPILDWEPSTYASGRGYDCSVSYALDWLQRVEKAYGVKPLIYMNANTLRSCDWTPVANSGYGLWLAGYVRNNGNLANVPSNPYGSGAFPFIAMWQWTSRANNGAWVGDANVFYGDESQWDAYAGGSPQKPDGTGTASKPSQNASKPNTSNSNNTATSCVVLRRNQYVTMFWRDWWNVRVPSGNVNRVYPGDRICHVGNNQTISQSRTYRVRSGDTLGSIAARLGISTSQLSGYRSGNPNLIYPGELLRY